jgi:hypothetical protein
MKTKIKTFTVIGIIIIAALALIRIIYVNTVLYPAVENVSYKIGDVVSCKSDYFGNRDKAIGTFDLTLNGTETLTKSELEARYPDIYMTDEIDVIVSMTVKNTSDMKFRVYPNQMYGITDGFYSNGGANPYMFEYLNSEISSLSLEPNEEINLLVPYPVTDTDSLDGLLVSLYPERVFIEF